ncbi:MAG: BPL-N domain-containing protein [Candidatus Thorarchaeota archaeon]
MKLTFSDMRITTAFVLVFLIVTPLEISAVSTFQESSEDLEGVSVALWTGHGALESSVIALEYLFAWMNATVIPTNETHILNGGLEDIDVLVFPGGSTSSYSSSLGSEGKQLIRDFISGGGSYFGICGGSLFGTRLRLNLFNGSYIGPTAGEGTRMMNMSVNRESSGPDLTSEPETYELLYWNSAYFSADNMTGIIPIVTYPSNGEAAMIAFHYGFGTVFLSSPHPEYEENDDRDGTTDFDYYDDQDSEWGLLLKVTKWLVDDSPEPSTTLPPTESITDLSDRDIPEVTIIYTIIGVIGVIAIITIVILKHR